MKGCAVRSCGNNIENRPDLRYFKLPKHTGVREEWMESCGISSANASNAFVCEIHFMPKDFRAPRPRRGKELKAHAVPVLFLGAGKSEAIDSEDEVSPCLETDEIQEVIEIPSKRNILKQEAIDTSPVKQESQTDTEIEVGRRPSRRAAQIAAKKIFNTVCHSGLRDVPLDLYDDVSVSKPITKPASTPRSTPVPKRKKKPGNIICAADNINLDLDVDIECKDEELSDIQKQFLMIAEHRYNMVMKNLRELQACNVKVIRNETPGTMPFDPPVPAKNEIFALSPTRTPSTCELIIKSELPKVVPMKLSTAT